MPLLPPLVFTSVRCQVMGPDMSSGTLEAFKFPKLNGSNYTEWRIYCQSTLQSQHLWLIVTGDKEQPSKLAATPAAGKEAEHAAAKKDWISWMKDDQAAMGLMQSAAEPLQWPHIEKAKNTKEIWDAWEKIHSKDQQNINVNYYFKELFTRKYVDGESMSDHVAWMLDLTHCITATGEKLSDHLIACSLVISLPRTPQWDLIKSQIFQLDEKSLTSETVSSRLQTEANHRSHEVSLENTALLAKKGEGLP